jgi:hypothetical protein
MWQWQDSGPCDDQPPDSTTWVGMQAFARCTNKNRRQIQVDARFPRLSTAVIQKNDSWKRCIVEMASTFSLDTARHEWLRDAPGLSNPLPDKRKALLL